MIHSERLYYTDSYLRHVETEVAAADDEGRRVVLRETNFYPTSGGQPHDLGTLNGIAVLDVVDDGEAVTHVLADPLKETSVRADIAWERRYDHMQQHTGQHLISAVFEELFHFPTLSFHMGEESSNIELGAKEITQEQVDAVVLRATEAARANPRIVIRFEEASQAQGLRKATGREGTIRVIEIPGMDRSACGGTHVATLAEVLPLQMREIEKVRGNARVSFVCGNRAIRRAQMDFQMLAGTAKAVATSLDNVEQSVSALQQRLADAEKQRQRLEAEAATRAGLDLYANTEAGEGGLRRAMAAERVIDENARTKAKAFASQAKAVLLMHSAEGLLLACSQDSGLNAGALLKQALAKFGARGGGSATLAQGNLPDRAILDDLAQAAGLRL